MRRQPSINKITRPALPNVFPRKRLFELLDGGWRHPVTWISGPPGSGKTTLAASWLDARKLPCLWYQMDAGDADIATFFYYLGLAAKKAAPRVRRPLQLLTPEYLLDVPTFSRRYFENLCSRLKPPFTIVFDNYHEVPSGSPFQEALRAGLSAIPEGVRVAVISRAEPPPAFSGMLAGNNMSLVGWEELRLTEEESGEIAQGNLGGGQDRKVFRWIHEKTGGWAAGLILLTKLVKRQLLDHRVLSTVRPDRVFDYFANEMFDKRTDEATRDFLLKTAALPRITPSIAERLTGNKEAGRILEELNSRNYFTEKRLGPELSYQYHPLFREFLQSRAEIVFTPAGRARLQTSAAELLEQAGQVEDAAELYRAAGDGQGLSRMILRHAPVLVGQGRHRTLEQWLLDLTPETRDAAPWLHYWLGICRMPFDLSDSRRHLEKAFEGFRNEGGDPAGFFLSWCGLVDTFVYERGRFAPLDRWIAAMEDRLTRRPKFPSPVIEARVAAAMFCALIYRQPHHPRLGEWEERVKAIILGSPDERFRIMIGHHLLLYYTWWRGDFGKATALINVLRPAKPSPEMDPLMMITWHAVEAAYYWMSASHEACLQAVSNGLEIARKSGVHVWDFMLLAQSVHSLVAADQFDPARERLATMRTVLNAAPMRPLGWAQYHYLMTWEAMGRNDATQALEEARSALADFLEGGSPLFEAVGESGMGHVLLSLNRVAQATVHIGRVREIARRIGYKAVEYLYLLLEAERGLFHGHEAKGLEALRKFMALAREQSIFNHPGWRSSQMSRLCAAALERDIEPDYVRTLISRRRLTPPLPPFEKGGPGGIWMEHWPWPVKIRTLGDFAVDVDDKPVRFSGKVQKKPLEMLKVLIAFGSSDVPEDRISEALWPDAEGDAARISFKTTLHRLRQLIQCEDAVHIREGKVSLDARCCWVDVWAFERMLESSPDESIRGQAAFGIQREGQKQGKARSAVRDQRSEILQRLGKALSLYRGQFLAGEDAPWAVSLRERLRDKFLRAVVALGSSLDRSGNTIAALDWYRKALDIDDLSEEFYRRLMACYMKLGKKADAAKVYERCRKTLAAGLGVEPSEETETLYHALMRK